MDTRTFIPVADMIAALQRLPADAQLCVTQSGYYCYGELAEIQLPEPYTIKEVGLQEHGIPKGTVVYSIGHSHQSY
jgi:hypothetical protein